MRMRYAIGIDIGTSGTKTVLFDEQGKTIAAAMEEYPLYQPQNGYAEQDPLDWYHAAVTTIQSVLQKSGIKIQTLSASGYPDKCTVWLCWTKTAMSYGGR